MVMVGFFQASLKQTAKIAFLEDYGGKNGKMVKLLPRSKTEKKIITTNNGFIF